MSHQRKQNYQNPTLTYTLRIQWQNNETFLQVAVFLIFILCFRIHKKRMTSEAHYRSNTPEK